MKCRFVLLSNPIRAQIADQVWGTDDKILYFSTNLFLAWLKCASFIVFQNAMFRPLPVQSTAVVRIINVARVPISLEKTSMVDITKLCENTLFVIDCYSVLYIFISAAIRNKYLLNINEGDVIMNSP